MRAVQSLPDPILNSTNPNRYTRNRLQIAIIADPLTDDPDAAIVAFIPGIPELERGRTARELATNTTFMEEGGDRFFSIADATGCWTDADFQDPFDNDAGSIYRIGVTVYCVSPLAELNGATNINFTELKFSARLNRDPQE
ncbi:MAG: hypothetical protein QGF91_00210 [Gammaproteobacteria bacterium]|jgi:hypothetical protein|nr:hypothetical protein [Gammaproteobacteria bacterium]